jgi:hypothetical protein
LKPAAGPGLGPTAGVRASALVPGFGARVGARGLRLRLRPGIGAAPGIGGRSEPGASRPGCGSAAALGGGSGLTALGPGARLRLRLEPAGLCLREKKLKKKQKKNCLRTAESDSSLSTLQN